MPTLTVVSTDAYAGSIAREHHIESDATLSTNYTSGVWSAQYLQYGTSVAIGTRAASATSLRASQLYLEFDLSALPANAVITSAALKLSVISTATGTNTTAKIKARVLDFGGYPITAADWQSRAAFNALPLFAAETELNAATGVRSIDASSGRSYLVSGAILRLALTTSLYEDGTVPTTTTSTYRVFTFHAPDGRNDVSVRPTLEITYDVPPANTSYHTPTFDNMVAASGTQTNVEAGVSASIYNAADPYLYAGLNESGGTYTNYEACLQFDTSTVSATPGTAELKIKVSNGAGLPSVETLYDVYAYDFGPPPIDASDYRTQAQVQAMTPIGTMTLPASSAVDTVITTTLSTSGITLSGSTRLMIVGRGFDTDVWPTGTTHFFDMGSVERGNGYPRLVLTLAPPPVIPIGTGALIAIGAGTLYARKNGTWQSID